MVSLGCREYGSTTEGEAAATFAPAKAAPDGGHTVPPDEAPAMPGAAKTQARASKQEPTARWTCKLHLPSGSSLAEGETLQPKPPIEIAIN